MTDENPVVADTDDDVDTQFIDDDTEGDDPPLDPTEPSQYANNPVLQDDIDETEE